MTKSLIAALVLGCTVLSQAADAAKIKALFISGGGYHDYEKTTPFLTERLGKMIPVEWTVKYGIDIFKTENFADGYDVLVYDCCFPGEKSPAGVENALKATRQGKPTVIIHCATVCFLTLPEWQKLVGQTIKGHDPYGPLSTEKLQPTHPIVRSFPSDWETEGDELYLVTEADPGIQPLLKAKSAKTGQDHVVAWTHEYGEGRVFATSLGHDLKTIEDEHYQKLLAEGILWVLGRSR